VALARAIAVNSRIVLMDEPLSNLDARLREEVRGKIRELAKQLGSTMLYVTHDQIEAMAIADRIALMQAGELLQVGAPLEIYHKPNCADVAEFFGSVNWLDAQVVESGVADSAIGKLKIESLSQIGDKVLLGFRPECLSLSGPSAQADGNCFRAKLGSRTFLGDQFVYTAVVNDRQLFGKSRAVPETTGGATFCHVSPSDIMVFPSRV
ncbi:MAG TPA: ABC transporter ATP-binding protein, partial [Candidatus Binatia bacterium]|nr:ABC transporter ATP-binding protein [Candidatus Binatia bacterium]